MIDTHIPASEYIARRKKLLRELKGAAAVVYAGEGSPPLVGSWHPDWDFYYLTGLATEPGAAVLFDPSNERADRRITLFLRPLNPEMERWDGFRDTINTKLKGETGFDAVMRTYALPMWLAKAAQRTKKLACLHPISAHTAPVSPDLAVFQQLAQRVPGLAIEDATTLLPRARSVKSKAEQKLISRAADATAAGFAALTRVLKPGVGEKDLEHAMTRGFTDAGGTGLGYNPIVGSGLNTCVLHYKDNDGTVGKDDLVLVDAGASVGSYTADVTRTYPASGSFTKRQGEVYAVVLRALSAATRAAKPGATMHQVDAAARAVIDKAGFADHFPHGIGHHLGIEVHDSEPGGTLAPGMIVTIEPGIYIESEKLGVRIEDDVLITEKGNRVLTNAIPKEIKDVEAQVRRKAR